MLHSLLVQKRLLIALLLLTRLPLPAPAQDVGITVEGAASVETPPDTVEIQGTISGEAELAADAIVKYRDNRRRVEEAIRDLKIDRLSVDWKGLRFGAGLLDPQAAQQAAMRGLPQVGNTAQVSVSDTATLTLTNINTLPPETIVDTLVRLIDVAKDAGLTLPPSGQSVLASFQLSNPTAAESEALSKAMADARKKAEEIAQSARVTLGAIRSVQVTSPARSKSNTATRTISYPYNMMMNQTDASNGTSTDLTQITIEIRLKVQFEITP